MNRHPTGPPSTRRRYCTRDRKASHVTFWFGSLGISCGRCGKFINTMVEAIPSLPDPFQVTCPYCSYTASYRKASIHSYRNVILAPSNFRVIAAVIAIGGLLVLLNLIARH